MVNKKNTFNIKSIKKTSAFKNLVHNDKIIWITDLEQNSQSFDGCLNMSEYLNNIHEVGLLKVNEEYKNFVVVAVCELNTRAKLHLDGADKQYMYLICDSEYRELFISIERCHPIFWYKFSSKKEFYDIFDQIYNIYNPAEYLLTFTNTTRGFVGTDRMLNATVDNLENFLSFNSFTEFLLWGSRWPDHPFRDAYEEGEVNTRANIAYTMQAMKQKANTTSTISVRSKFSKSIITLENHEGAYILNIQYNPSVAKQILQINTEFGKEYQSDLPTDVVMAIAELPFVTHTGLLELEGITPNNFSMASLVANSKDMYVEMLNVVDGLLSKIKKDTSSEYVAMLHNFKKNINVNIKLYEIFTDDKLTKFIDEKVDSYKKKKQSVEEIECELETQLKDKLSNINDDKFKNYLLNMLKDIIC